VRRQRGNGYGSSKKFNKTSLMKYAMGTKRAYSRTLQPPIKAFIVYTKLITRDHAVFYFICGDAIRFDNKIFINFFSIIILMRAVGPDDSVRTSTT